MDFKKSAIMLDKLERFVRQRPGFDRGNYASWADYRSDVRAASKYLRPALNNIDALRHHPELKPSQISGAAPTDRLTWNEERQDWEYTTGQYFPTEYRAAAFRVSDSILRDVRGYGSSFCG